MDEIIALILGLFIANYEAKNYPYLTCVVKALLTSIFGFLIFSGKQFLDHLLTVEKIIFNLKVTACLWVFLSVSFCFVEFMFSRKK